MAIAAVMVMATGVASASAAGLTGAGSTLVAPLMANYELPNLKNIEIAAAVVTKVPPSNEINITNPPKSAATAYPISTFTYAIVPHNAAQKGFVQQFLTYAITKGQASEQRSISRSSPRSS